MNIKKMVERVLTQPFAVVGAIIEKDEKVLLVKEAGTMDKGKWNQPAGWIEVGQSPAEAVVKEVKEETGLDFDPTGLIGIYSTAYVYKAPFRHGQIPHPIKFIFRGRVIGGELIESNDEIAETNWFAVQEIMKMDREVLRDMDIKQEVQDYFAGRNFPLDIIKHAVLK